MMLGQIIRDLGTGQIMVALLIIAVRIRPLSHAQQPIQRARL